MGFQGWDEPGLSQGQAQFVPGISPGFFIFNTVEAQLVPGTNPVGPQKEFMC